MIDGTEEYNRRGDDTYDGKEERLIYDMGIKDIKELENYFRKTRLFDLLG